MPEEVSKATKGLVFMVTWTAYCSAYLLRKPIGVMKSDLQNQLGLSDFKLGLLDTALLLPYAFVQVLLGSLGDRFGAHRCLTLNLIGSALSMVMFGSVNYYVMLFLLFLNGASQSTAWPNCVKIISGVLTDTERTTFFGLWGTCSFAGGFLGTSLSVYLQKSYKGELIPVFLYPSVIVGLVGIGVMLLLLVQEDTSKPVAGTDESLVKAPKVTLSFCQLYKIKTLPQLAWATFFSKFVRYFLYMWLPFYFNKKLEYSISTAGLASMAFDIGGVIGSSLLGIVIKRCCRGNPYLGCFVSTVVCSVALVGLLIAGKLGMAVQIFLVFVIGFTNCGIDPIISGTLPAKLGDEYQCQSAISAAVNGFGSVGTVLQGPLVGAMAGAWGWNSVMWSMIVSSVLTGAATLHAWILSKSEDRTSAVI